VNSNDYIVMHTIVMPPPVGKGAISVAFVLSSLRPSVCPFVAYGTYRIIREPKGLACPNLEGRFPALDAARIPASRSNGHRSGLEAGGDILCRLNPAPHCLLEV